MAEHSLETESEEANQGMTPKPEGDRRKADQRIEPRRIGDRGGNWRSRIEYRHWKARERRRLEGERRRASKERRQVERRGAQGDRRKGPPDRRALLNPRPRRSTDIDHRVNNNDDLSVRPGCHRLVATLVGLEDSVAGQEPPGSAAYSTQPSANAPGSPSEAAPSGHFFPRLTKVSRQVRERFLRLLH